MDGQQYATFNVLIECQQCGFNDTGTLQRGAVRIPDDIGKQAAKQHARQTNHRTFAVELSETQSTGSLHISRRMRLSDEQVKGSLFERIRQWIPLEAEVLSYET